MCLGHQVRTATARDEFVAFRRLGTGIPGTESIAWAIVGTTVTARANFSTRIGADTTWL